MSFDDFNLLEISGNTYIVIMDIYIQLASRLAILVITKCVNIALWLYYRSHLVGGAGDKPA